MNTFLFIFAHPDDESFTGAGIAMKYGAAGVRTVLITATLGEGGKRGDPPVCAADQLAGYRERELREAVAIICLAMSTGSCTRRLPTKFGARW